MPIPPEPFILVCQHCGWRRRVKPRSDVLLPGEILNHCPRCAHKLEQKPMPFWQRILFQ